MKKFLYFLLFCLITLSSACSANDPSYEAGQQMGSAITSHWGSIAAGGNDNKVFWYAEDYDFSKVKAVILTTNVSPYASDPYLKFKYIDILNKKFKDKGISFIDESAVINDYNKYVKENNINPEYYSILAYVYETYKTTNYMKVNIYAYSNRPHPGIRTMGDCWVDFKMIDVDRFQLNVPNSMDVLFYNDQRLDAINASKGGLLDRITGRFKSKFNDAIEKKPITE